MHEAKHELTLSVWLIILIPGLDVKLLTRIILGYVTV